MELGAAVTAIGNAVTGVLTALADGIKMIGGAVAKLLP